MRTAVLPTGGGGAGAENNSLSTIVEYVPRLNNRVVPLSACSAANPGL
jgi:hypothetical protein